MIQQNLLPKDKIKYTFGGKSTKGKRKEARTIIPNLWVHLVLKSKKAYGNYSFLHKERRQKIENLIRQKAKKFNIQIKDAVNMGNHLHMKLKVKYAKDFTKFLRSISGQIARIVTGARKGKPFGKFWDAIAFTRIITSALEELRLKGYFKANRIEREKGYKARTEMLAQFNSWLRTLKRDQSFNATTS